MINVSKVLCQQEHEQLEMSEVEKDDVNMSSLMQDNQEDRGLPG